MANLSDEINRMIIDLITNTEYTSASPGNINRVLTVGQTTNPDLEEQILNIIQETVKFKMEEQTGTPVSEQEINKAIDESFGGPANVGTIQKFAKNPRAFAMGLVRSLPFIGGIVAAKDFADALIQEIARIDSFFKVFIPDITDLHNQLRDREEMALIQVGDVQQILAVRSGGTSPRRAYNTYNIFNKNRNQLESDFAIRDNSGVD